MGTCAAPVALVTGAGRGIGFEVTRGLSERSMTVLLGARHMQRAEEQAAILRTHGASAHVVYLDVTKPAGIRAAATWISDRFGQLDVLVNNAGVVGDRGRQVPGQTDLEVVREVFDTNVFGVIAVTEAMLPLLRRSAAGRIVNLSSSVGSMTRMTDPEHYFAGLPGSLAYAPSKAALNQITVQYAKQLRPDGILVNAADPGPCATDLTTGFRGLTRTAADGAAVVIHLATLGNDGPTGQYMRDTGTVPW